MPEHSDGIAEELERQLQITLSTAAVIARRGLARRQHTLEQAQQESDRAARAAGEQIETERRLAAAGLQPVFDEAWWRTATPAEIAGMWEQANSWRDPAAGEEPQSTFDRAAHRIDDELRDKVGLDPAQLQTLAAVQELEGDHQTADQRARTAASTRGFDGADRREQLRARLVAAGVPESAIDARTLADIARPTSPHKPSLRPPILPTDQRHGRPPPSAATAARSAWRARPRSQR